MNAKQESSRLLLVDDDTVFVEVLARAMTKRGFEVETSSEFENALAAIERGIYDFAVVDLKAKRTITNDWMKTQCGWTPFDGMEVTGWPKATIVRGRIVMREDELIGSPIGEPVRFQDTLPREETA